MFTDGTSCSDVDAVISATGYELRMPFLEKGNVLRAEPSTSSNMTRGHKPDLVTNFKYIFPLHEHIFPLSSEYPVNALSFIGLLVHTDYRAADIAQSMYVAHSIANASLLPSRNELLRKLAVHEEDMRSQGYDPYSIGHRMIPEEREAGYQDDLIAYLKKREAIPEDRKHFVEEWRRYINTDRKHRMQRGWKRVEKLGTQEQWLEGVETEDEWVELMRRLDSWQASWEQRHR